MRTQVSLVRLPSRRRTQPFPAPLPAARLNANFCLVVGEAARLHVRTASQTTADLTLGAVLYGTAVAVNGRVEKKKEQNAREGQGGGRG